MIDLHELNRRALAAIRELRAENGRLRSGGGEPIAIVAMTCRFPGGIDGPEDYWSLLREGRDALSDMPRDRWSPERFQDEDPNGPGLIYARRGGFLDNLMDFDRHLFGMSPEDALAMDPQQRLLVELSWQALELANMAPSSNPVPNGSTTGVFVGIANAGYSRFSLHSGDPSAIGASSVPGFAPSFASGRLSYLFGLDGPTMTMDTACSSSLVALHTACASLRSRECDRALVGGVNALVAPEEYVYFCNAAALSPSSRSRPFDAEADGYVRGEGGAVLVLRRLDDAVREGDRIEAVINGSAVNHDGRSNGLTAPNGESQKALLRAAYRTSGIEPTALGYVEAHGTGTLLGDPIEATALGEFLLETDRDGVGPLPIGSVKSNLGHLEAAAGLAGVIKSVLALQHGEIPPSLNCERLNPHIDWARLPIDVARGKPTPWPVETTHRHAGVSSFGFSGTNAHVVLSSAPTQTPAPETSPAPWRTVPVLVSAASPSALSDSLERLAVRARNADAADVLSIVRTLAVGRAQLPCGVSFDIDDPEVLADTLREQVRGIAVRMPVANGSDTFSTARARAAALPVPLTTLPTYPFQHERYWPDRLAIRTPDTTPLEPPPGPASADLFDRETDTPERRLYRILAHLTGLDEAFIAARSGLADLNPDSITLVKLKFLLKQRLGADIPLAVLAEGPEWGRLLTFSDVTGGQLPSQDRPNPTSSRSCTITLTPLQQAYWVGRRVSEKRGACGSYFYLEFEAGQVSTEALESAWNELIHRHQMLRASVEDHQISVAADRPRYAIARHTLPEGDDTERLAAIATLRGTLSHRTFESGAWPLFVIEAATHQGGTRVFLGIDEIIADGASIGVLMREWQALAERGTAPKPLAYEYSQYAAFMSARAADADADLAYWKHECRDLADGPDLPASTRVPTGRRKRLRAVLGAEVLAGIEADAKRHGVSLTAWVLHRFASVLASYGSRRDFTLTLTYFNRLPVHPDVDDLVGPLASTTLFGWRGDMTPEAVQARLRSNADHARVDGVTLLRYLRKEGIAKPDLTQSVVFTSMIENFEAASDDSSTWLRACSHVESQTPQVLIDHQIGRSGDTLVLSWDYAVGLLDEGAVEHLFALYGSVLSGAPTREPRAALAGATTVAATPVQLSYAYGYRASGRSCQIYQELRVARIDPLAVEAGWLATLERYEALRAIVDDSGMVQPMTRADWRLAAPMSCRDESDPRLVERRAALSVGERAPAVWPPFEIAVTHLEDEDDIVHLAIDMIAVDWPSQQTIHAAFCANYHRFATSSPRPPHPASRLVARDRPCTVDPVAKRYWSRKLESLRAAKLRETDPLEPARVERSSRIIEGWHRFVVGCKARGAEPQDVLCACFSRAVSSLTRDGAVPLVQVDFERPPGTENGGDAVGDFTRLAWAMLPSDESPLEELANALRREREADWRHDPNQGLMQMGRFGPHRRGGVFALPFVFSRVLGSELGELAGGFEIGRGVSSTPGVAIDDVSVVRDDCLAINWDVDHGVLAAAAVEAAFARYVDLILGIARTTDTAKGTIR